MCSKIVIIKKLITVKLKTFSQRQVDFFSRYYKFNPELSRITWSLYTHHYLTLFDTVRGRRCGHNYPAFESWGQFGPYKVSDGLGVLADFDNKEGPSYPIIKIIRVLK